MRSRLAIAGVIVAALLGCASKEARLAGTWKAVPVKTISSSNLADVQRSSMLSLVTQALEVEFNRDGKFKFGAGVGWGSGTYSWEGEVLKLRFNTFAPQTPLQFRFEGSELVEVTDFESDVKLRFVKK